MCLDHYLNPLPYMFLHTEDVEMLFVIPLTFLYGGVNHICAIISKSLLNAGSLTCFSSRLCGTSQASNPRARPPTYTFHNTVHSPLLLVLIVQSLIPRETSEQKHGQWWKMMWIVNCYWKYSLQVKVPMACHKTGQYVLQKNIDI